MVFQPIPDTALFVARFGLPSGEVGTFGGYSRDEVLPWTAGNLTSLADELSDAIVASYIPFLSEEISFLGVKGRDMGAEFGEEAEIVHEPPIDGTLASPALPPNVALVVSWIGTPGAAPRRGRSYLMSPAESQVTGELLLVGAQASLLTAAQAISDALSREAVLLNSNAHVIVSRFQGKSLVVQPNGETVFKPTKRDPDAVTNTVASARITRRVDSQRRRLSDIESA